MNPRFTAETPRRRGHGLEFFSPRLCVSAVKFLSPRTICAALVVAVQLATFQSHGQGMLTITFDGEPLPQPGQRYVVNSPYYEESGMRFSSAGDGHGNYGIMHVGAEHFENYPHNGTPYLQTHQFGLGQIYAQTDPMVHGPLFGVFSIDLAGFSSGSPGFQVYVNASRSDGAYLRTVFSGTGLEFQTFQFDARWFSGLSSIEVGLVSGGFSMDNLVVIIPEPATGALFTLGALTFAFWQRRRRETGA